MIENLQIEIVRGLKIKDYSYSKHVLHVLLCLYTSFECFSTTGKHTTSLYIRTLHGKVFAHVCICTFALLILDQCVPCGQPKKVCMGGKSGVRIEICLVADTSRFRGGACRKMQGMSTYLLRYGASHPLCCRMPQLRFPS